jgi:SPASM domain peptide maturase of grasp-with-spasm system
MLFEILLLAKYSSINELKELYKGEQNEGIDNYFNYLTEMQFGFYTDDPKNYPNLDLSWDSPFEITNCVVNNSLKQINNSGLFLEVDALVIIINELNVHSIKELIELCTHISYQSIQIFVGYNKAINHILKELSGKINIAEIVIFNSPQNKQKMMGALKIIFCKEKIDLYAKCNVHLNYFSCNISHFTEAQHFNTYLNKKLYIDPKGNLKNSPNSEFIFANLEEINEKFQIKDSMNHPETIKQQTTNKDKIEVCKDCEFRYMCVDNRIPLQRDNNTWYHKTVCNYDPYTATWR